MRSMGAGLPQARARVNGDRGRRGHPAVLSIARAP